MYGRTTPGVLLYQDLHTCIRPPTAGGSQGEALGFCPERGLARCPLVGRFDSRLGGQGRGRDGLLLEGATGLSRVGCGWKRRFFRFLNWFRVSPRFGTFGLWCLRLTWFFGLCLRAVENFFDLCLTSVEGFLRLSVRVVEGFLRLSLKVVEGFLRLSLTVVEGFLRLGPATVEGFRRFSLRLGFLRSIVLILCDLIIFMSVLGFWNGSGWAGEAFWDIHWLSSRKCRLSLDTDTSSDVGWAVEDARYIFLLGLLVVRSISCWWSGKDRCARSSKSWLRLDQMLSGNLFLMLKMFLFASLSICQMLSRGSDL